MSKIFRLHSGASESIEHWQDTGSHLHDTFIASINDPSGNNAASQITSIPSPFARMDLVRTAFKNVNLGKNLDGTTIYHRLISDSLDVGEIFFNIQALTGKIEIMEWSSGISENGRELTIDANSDLGHLLNNGNPKHRLLAETLKMYLFQDKKAFNFADLKNIYLLNYRQGPEPINVIGGTSPATLFFSSANDLSFVDIVFGNDGAFDGKYSPLHKRNIAFIRWLYAFRESFPRFSERFADFSSYMDLSFTHLDEEAKNEVRSLKRETYDKDYVKIAVGEAAGNNAEILGVPLKAKNYGAVPSADDNDFLIDATKTLTGIVPAVLPNEPFNEPLRLAGSVWESSFYKKVPFYDERPLKDRTLPNQAHVKYPYLTVSDFLQPYLIELPFPIDNSKFVDGHYPAGDHSYVLPLKKEFFIYFSIDDLEGTVSDGAKRFEMQDIPGGVKVILRIPIKNGRYIQYSRLYMTNQVKDRVLKADEKANQGVVMQNQFTLLIYPFLKPAPGINPHYRILFVDRDVQPLTKRFSYDVAFFTEAAPQSPLPVQATRVRSSKEQAEKVTSLYHILEEGFDFIEISNSSYTGILVPTFKVTPSPHKAFTFAIDFGTTNTHIEYKVGNESPRPFDITEKDIQVGALHHPDDEVVQRAFVSMPDKQASDLITDLIDIIKEEFLPLLIRPESQYKFPQRTVVNDNGSFNPDEATFALADFNIPFWYLKENHIIHSEVTPNLKWGDFKLNKRLKVRLNGFLQQILLMIRNKVLLNGGSLADTKIIWFYPSSMPTFKRATLESFWNKEYATYFPGAGKLYKMSESLAPFYYYYHKEGVRPHDRPAVSIDIGGGTSDIVIYQGEHPILLTSFRFAANSIFGDGNGSTFNDNGFVQRYENIINDALSNTSAKKLKDVYNNLKRVHSSSVELVEFFFSLEENKEIRDNKIPLSFSKILVEDIEFKLLFVLFYAALVYHIAHLMKAKGLPVPDYITFSGNGSKVIRVIDGSSDLSILLAFTKVIFEDVYQIEKSPSIEFRFFRNPKEITCKGGLECTDFSQFAQLEDQIKTVLIGTDTAATIPPEKLLYSQAESPTVIDAVCHEVSGFIDRFFDWNAKFNYYQNFGVSPKKFPEYKDLLKSKLKIDLISGIKAMAGETQDGRGDDSIQETLFFYPLVGAINRLANRMHKDSTK